MHNVLNNKSDFVVLSISQYVSSFKGESGFFFLIENIGWKWYPERCENKTSRKVCL